MTAGYVHRISFNEKPRDVRLQVASDAGSASHPTARGSVDVPNAALAKHAAQAESARHRETLSQLTALRSLWEEVADGVREIEQRRQASLDELQFVAVELAVAMASEIVRRTVEQNEFPLAELLREAIGRLQTEQRVCVRLHPDDLKQIEAVSPQVGQDLPHGISYLADRGLQRGSCLVEGPDFGLLSTIEQQIDDLQRCLREGLQHAQIERRATQEGTQGVRRFPDRRETA